MVTYTEEELREALGPIASLISKSEKAQTKLAPGTWQHSMLEGNLRALELASAMMTQETAGSMNCSGENLQQAREYLANMIAKTESAQMKFATGTSQNTLLRNRLRALRIAETFIENALDSFGGEDDQ